MELQAFMKYLKSPPHSHSALIQLGCSPNDVEAADSSFPFSLPPSLSWWRGLDSCWGFRTKLSPHCFGLSISSLPTNTLISIKCCSGRPESHDISYTKESTEQLWRKNCRFSLISGCDIMHREIADIVSVEIFSLKTNTTKYMNQLNL